MRSSRLQPLETIFLLKHYQSRKQLRTSALTCLVLLFILRNYCYAAPEEFHIGIKSAESDAVSIFMSGNNNAVRQFQTGSIPTSLQVLVLDRHNKPKRCTADVDRFFDQLELGLEDSQFDYEVQNLVRTPNLIAFHLKTEEVRGILTDAEIRREFKLPSNSVFPTFKYTQVIVIHLVSKDRKPSKFRIASAMVLVNTGQNGRHCEIMVPELENRVAAFIRKRIDEYSGKYIVSDTYDLVVKTIRDLENRQGINQ